MTGLQNARFHSKYLLVNMRLHVCKCNCIHKISYQLPLENSIQILEDEDENQIDGYKTIVEKTKYHMLMRHMYY